MAIGNEELMLECFPKHSSMGTARMKKDKETEEGKKRGVIMGNFFIQMNNIWYYNVYIHKSKLSINYSD